MQAILKSVVESITLKQPDPEVQRGIDRDNLINLRLACLFVVAIELILVSFHSLLGDRACRWFTLRLWCYIGYAAFSAAYFFMFGHTRKTTFTHRSLMAIGLFYCSVSIAWSMLISAIDYAEGRQVFVFITNVVCVAGLAFIPPRISIPFFTAIFGVFYAVLVLVCGAELSFPTNYIILLLMILVTSATRYHIKLSDTTAHVEYRKLSEEHQRLSLFDDLTGARNRRSLAADATRLLHYPLFVMLIDIDNFKTMNDTYGHDYGDRLLQQVSNRLLTAFPCENVYRYGGDEFIVAIRSDDPEEHLSKINCFQESLAACAADDDCPEITVSGGYTHTIMHTLDDLQHIIVQIDRTMYQSKKDGKDRILKAQLDGTA